MSDDSVSVLSPEGVSLDLPLAGPGPRVLAYAVDYALILVIDFFLIMLVIAAALPIVAFVSDMMEPARQALEASPDDPDALMLYLMPLIVAFLVFSALSEVIYFTFFELVTQGRSPGKMLLGLRVTGEGGLPLDLRGSLLRNVMRLVDVLPTSYAVGLTTILLSDRWQRLGDLAAGTLVIRTDAVAPEPEIALGSGLVPLRLSRQQLGRVGADELALARGTLRRIEQVDGQRAGSVLRGTAEALRARLEIEDDGTEDDAVFLRRLVLAMEVDDRRV